MITNPNNASKTVVPKPKLKFAPLQVALIAVISLLIIAAIVIFTLFVYPNISPAQDTQSSVSSSSIQSSSETFSKLNFSFPRFFDPKNNNFDNNFSASSSNAQNSQVTQSRNNTEPFKIEFAPKNTANTRRQIFTQQDCGSSISTLNGVYQYQSLENQAQTMQIVNKRSSNNQQDQKNYDQAVNFINKDTELMADNSTGFGPDFLQIFRTNCDKSTINKFLEMTDQIRYPNTNKLRAIVDLRSPNNFVDVSVTVYAIKDDNLISLNWKQNYNDFFTVQQRENCQTNGIPNRNCFQELINKESNLKKRLEEQANNLVKTFEI
jgi:hypothetical protein